METNAKSVFLHGTAPCQRTGTGSRKLYRKGPRMLLDTKVKLSAFPENGYNNLSFFEKVYRNKGGVIFKIDV